MLCQNLFFRCPQAFSFSLWDVSSEYFTRWFKAQALWWHCCGLRLWLWLCCRHGQQSCGSSPWQVPMYTFAQKSDKKLCLFYLLYFFYIYIQNVYIFIYFFFFSLNTSPLPLLDGEGFFPESLSGHSSVCEDSELNDPQYDQSLLENLFYKTPVSWGFSEDCEGNSTKWYQSVYLIFLQSTF